MPNRPEREKRSRRNRDTESSIQGPHNRFVLGYFGTPREARSMLDVQLPVSLKKIIRLDELVVENSHFVDEHMSEVESDLLFRIPRIDHGAPDVYVYVLWEHQRKRDSLMVLRMWIYLGRIYRQLVQEGDSRGCANLPFVYPIVLFQGTGGWEKGLVLEDLIDSEGLDPELRRWIPKFEIDLIRLDEDTPRVRPADPIASLGMSLMRAVMRKEVRSWLEEHIEDVDRIYPENRNPAMLILSYTLLSGAGLTPEEFRSIVNAKGNSSMKYEAGSVAEQLVAEGKTEGKAELQRDIAIRLIRKKMSDEEISEISDLPINAVAELRSEIES